MNFYYFSIKNNKLQVSCLKKRQKQAAELLAPDCAESEREYVQEEQEDRLSRLKMLLKQIVFNYIIYFRLNS